MTEGSNEATHLRLATPVSPEPPAGLKGAIEALEAREARSRQRLREVRREADALRLRADRATAILEQREKAVENAHRREEAMRHDLKLADATIRRLDRAAVAADARLREMGSELKELRAENRVLAGRAARLKRIEESRTQRTLQSLWRIRSAIRHPLQLARKLRARAGR